VGGILVDTAHKALPHVVELVAQRLVVQFVEPFASEQHNVHWRLSLRQCAKVFARDALYPIALNGAPDMLAREHESQAMYRLSIASCEQQHIPVRCTCVRLVKYTLKITGSEQSPGFGEARVELRRAHSSRLSSRSGRQAFAALGAAAAEHQTAALGGHPGTETVGAAAFDHTGLKRSFHGRYPD